MRRAKRPATAPTRVLAYIRVSLEKQASEGVSLETQEAQVRGYASLYGLELVDVIVDPGACSDTLDRPGLAIALERLKRGEADGLLVAKLDRLTRSVRDLGTLIDEYFDRAALLSVAENIDTRSAAGRLVLNVLASVAQWEREAIGERTSAVMQHMRAQGLFTGGEAPYGFALGEAGRLLENPAEQAVLARARELRAKKLSLRDVAADLAEEGKLSRAGRPFQPAQIARMTG